MKLRDILTRPAKFRNRPKLDPRNAILVKKLRDTPPPNIEDPNEIKKYNDTITFIFNVRSQSDPKKVYDCIILIMNETVTLNSEVKLYCSCPSFKYEFAYLLWRNNSLYGDSFDDFTTGLLLNKMLLKFRRFLNRFRTAKYKRPPKRNNIPYICKHLESCLVHVLRHT